MPRRAFLILILAVVPLAACSQAPAGVAGSPGAAGTPGPAASTTAADVEAAGAILEAAKLADSASLGALEGIRFTPAGLSAAASAITAGATGDRLWAATYVYASSPGDPAPLLAIVAAGGSSPSVRTMAGAGLIATGHIEGFDALIAGLGEPGPVEGAEPPDTVWEFASSVLERYTHAGVGPPTASDEAARAAISTAWTTWLTTNRAKLRFDAPTSLWVTA